MRSAEIYDKLKKNIGKVIVGKENIIELILTAIVSEGHILLEDVPGTGKTKLAKAIAKSMDISYKRIQFTPDLMPSDITGLSIYNQKENSFLFQIGPVFCNILLADEINRATPRTQAGLLECMEERQVTVDGITYPMDDPFVVIATQNPIETAGTFPLPEAQTDRFMIKLHMDFPNTEEEIQILDLYNKEDPLNILSSICDRGNIQKIKEEANQVYVHPLIKEYIVKIIQSTRKQESVRSGVSPRGTLALLHAAKSHASIVGRNFVTPEDIQLLAVPVLAHRLLLHSSQINAEDIIYDIMTAATVPTENFNI